MKPQRSFEFFRGLFSCVVLAGIRTFSGLKSLHASKLCADLLEAALDMRSDSKSRVATWVVLWFRQRHVARRGLKSLSAPTSS